MKRIFQTATVALFVMLGGSVLNNISAQPDYDDNYGGGDEVSYQTFYDELSPHGRWIEYPEYGYVWAPNEGTGFRPYETNGHWVWTDADESMWVSDYSWGWAPFHYGRWFHDPYYGWMWVPGYEYSPAWVAWRDGGDYYGWAPLRPGFHIGINISIGSYNPPIDYWSFAPRRYISSPQIYNHCIDRSRNVTIINNTTIININNRRNNVFGPRRLDAERYAGRINPVRFRESSRPGRTTFRNNEVSSYRPRIQRDNNRQFTPRTFDRYERNGQRAAVANRSRDNASTRANGNNLPNRNENRTFDRRNNNEVRRPQANGQNNRRSERRNVFDRDANNNGNTQQRNNDRTMRRPAEQRNNPEVRPQQENNNERRRNVFDRNNGNNNNNNAQQGNNERRMREPIDRPVQPQAAPQQRNRNEQRPNANERNRNNNSSAQQNRQQTQPRQFENRNNNSSAQQNRQQTQPRQFENRRPENNNREQPAGNNNDRGRRSGRR